MKCIAVVGARLNSSRLPGKHLLSLAGKPLIERVVERLRKCSSLNKIIVATTADEYNLPLVNWAETCEFADPFAYTGDVNDLMGRINAVFESECPDYIVYICGDCPLLEPSFIEHALAQLQANPHMDSTQLKKGTITIHEGIAAYSHQGWKKLMRISTSDLAREHVGYADTLTPTLTKLEIEDSADYSTIQHRISVDTPADYNFMQQVYERWYRDNDKNSIVDLKWVQDELIRDKTLREINAHVVQKNPRVAYKKVALFCHVSEKIGLGHLRRCAMIASALQENLGFGTTIHICGEQRTLHWLTTATRWYNSFTTLADEMAHNENQLWILDMHPEFVDLNTLQEKCTEARSIKNTRVLALDRLSALLDCIDLLFIPSFYSSINNADKNPKISYGWDHYLIPERQSRIKKRQIIVLTGGSDALDYGHELPTLIEKLVDNSWTLIWIQGPYAKPPILANKTRWTLVKNPLNLDLLMEESLVSISAYGLSLFESMASACCTLLLPVQHLCSKEEIDALKQTESCIVLQSVEEIQTVFDNVINNDFQRNKTSDKAASLFSGEHGMSLLIKKVESLLSDSHTNCQAN